MTLSRVHSSTKYTHSSVLLEQGVGLPIQSPTLMRQSYSSGRQGILFVMMSLHLLFEVWWLSPKADRPFHSLFFLHQKSLIREHPDWANTHPSLRPLTPRGVPLALSIDELPKSGCLRVSAAVDGSNLMRPDLTFSHAPTMLFHIEHCSFFDLGAAKSQLRSVLVGPCRVRVAWFGRLYAALVPSKALHRVQALL